MATGVAENEAVAAEPRVVGDGQQPPTRNNVGDSCSAAPDEDIDARRLEAMRSTLDSLIALATSGSADPFGEDNEEQWHPPTRRRRIERMNEKRDETLRRVAAAIEQHRRTTKEAQHHHTHGFHPAAAVPVSPLVGGAAGGGSSGRPLAASSSARGTGILSRLPFVVSQRYTDEDGDDNATEEGVSSASNNNHNGSRGATPTSTGAQQQPPHMTYEEFMSSNQRRVPRRGEMTVTAEEIAEYESLGYVMSGSKNRGFEKAIEGLQAALHHRQADSVRLDIVAEEHRRRDERAVSHFKQLLDGSGGAVGTAPPQGH